MDSLLFVLDGFSSLHYIKCPCTYFPVAILYMPLQNMVCKFAMAHKNLRDPIEYCLAGYTFVTCELGSCLLFKTLYLSRGMVCDRPEVFIPL
jgi:hypothetical protein